MKRQKEKPKKNGTKVKQGVELGRVEPVCSTAEKYARKQNGKKLNKDEIEAGESLGGKQEFELVTFLGCTSNVVWLRHLG